MRAAPTELLGVRVDGPLLELVTRVHERLRERSERLALAESCTGGLAGGAMTAVAGASDVFDHGVVTYSDTAKVELLGVPEQTLLHTGAVSGPTARAMAVGVRDRLDGTDWGLSITGLAGPGGGRPGKPVGTVYVGIAGDGDAAASSANRFRFDGDRAAIRRQSVRAALELALDTLVHERSGPKRPP